MSGKREEDRGGDRPGEIAGHWLSRRHNSPHWCATWFDSQSRQTIRRSLGTPDLRIAEGRLAEFVAKRIQPENERPEDIALATVFVRYWEAHAQHRPSADQARHALREWNDHFGEAVAADVKPRTVREFVTALSARGLSGGYIKRILSVGKAALNWAYREGELQAPPFVDLSLAQAGEPRERYVTLEEMAWLFRAATVPHVRLYLLLACGTAARPKAILDLGRDQVDTELGLLRLNPSGRAQNRKRRPTLPLCPTLRTLVEQLPAGPLVHWKGQPLLRTKMMFERLRLRAANLLRDDAAAKVRALRGEGKRSAAMALAIDVQRRSRAMLDITAYAIRHTMAMDLRRRGVSVWEVAGWLGHSSGYRTTEIYAKAGPDHLAAAVAATESYFQDLRKLAGGDLAGPVTAGLRVDGVRVDFANVPQVIDGMVGATGIEPVTPTMST